MAELEEGAAGLVQLLFGKHSAVATDKTWWHFREKEGDDGSFEKLDQNHLIVKEFCLTILKSGGC